MVGDRSSGDGHVLRRVYILPPKGISSGERRCIAAGQRRLHSKDLVAAYRIFFLAWLGLARLGCFDYSRGYMHCLDQSWQQSMHVADGEKAGGIGKE